MRKNDEFYSCNPKSDDSTSFLSKKTQRTASVDLDVCIFKNIIYKKGECYMSVVPWEHTIEGRDEAIFISIFSKLSVKFEF